MEKVLGLGNALVDILLKLESDSFLEKNNLPKGSMQLVDINLSNKLIDASKEMSREQASGGSAANTIHGLSNLGAKTGYIGKVGEDEIGNFFRNDMEKNNIETKLFMSKTNSGKAIAFVSPDSERTFATYLGAAVELSADNLTSDLFKGYKYFHIEGYLVLNNDLVMKAVELAKENNCKVSLDLASYNVVEDNLEFLQNMVKKHVDIVFANEEEAKAFTGMEPEDAVNEIAKHCEIAIVKIGKDGSLVKNNGDITRITPAKPKVVDTTGAGDLYASGFLYGLTKGMTMKQCGDAGTICSSRVIEYIGAKMPDEKWIEINNLISKL